MVYQTVVVVRLIEAWLHVVVHVWAGVLESAVVLLTPKWALEHTKLLPAFLNPCSAQ